MSDAAKGPAADEGKGRRWFVILAIVTLVGFCLFVAAITVLAVRIPELKKPRFGVLESGAGVRPA
jgi:hypothetical protein